MIKSTNVKNESFVLKMTKSFLYKFFLKFHSVKHEWMISISEEDQIHLYFVVNCPIRLGKNLICDDELKCCFEITPLFWKFSRHFRLLVKIYHRVFDQWIVEFPQISEEDGWFSDSRKIGFLSGLFIQWDVLTQSTHVCR